MPRILSSVPDSDQFQVSAKSSFFSNFVVIARHGSVCLSDSVPCRKKEIGKSIDTYRKAAIFWTRNPKLVNPMKDRRIWVQVAKNFEPFIRLTEEEVRQELFDFNEKFLIKASDLGPGKHKIAAEVFASWQKHDYTESGNIKNNSKELEITVN